MSQDDAALQGLRMGMQIEVEGERFYHKAAKSVADEKGKEVFLSLARDEAMHREYLERAYESLSQGNAWPAQRVRPPRIAKVFPTKIELEPKTHQLEALKMGMEMEIKSRELYQGLAERTEQLEGKELYNSLAEWEGVHLTILQAEYNHLTGTGLWFDIQDFDLEVY